MKNQPIDDNKYFSGDEKFLSSVIKKRKRDSNKNDYGRVLLVCGSKQYIGAAYFSAQGAVRSGSGVVYMVIPDIIYGLVGVKTYEPVILPVESNQDGAISKNSIGDILQSLQKCDACLIGPGLSMSQDISEILEAVLTCSNVPVIIDADGINILAANIDLLKKTKCPVILTPHDGEFGRLLNASCLSSYANDDKIKTSIAFAKEYNVILLRKGYRTVVVAQDYPVFINNSGNPGMAKAGAGDVLSGIITSLCGQKINPFYATCAGAYIHGLAGDKCAYYFGEYGMTPSDMLKFIPLVFKDIWGN